VRHNFYYFSFCIQEFLSTHPQGVRLIIISFISYANYFYPRTLKGCDTADMATINQLSAFLSTHPQGVRQPQKALALQMFLGYILCELGLA